MRPARLLVLLAGVVSPAVAQQADPAAPMSGSFATTNQQSAPVKRLLVDGYEVKAGFADGTGGAYMVLQKATSAYLCHSNPSPTCEKLN